MRVLLVRWAGLLALVALLAAHAPAVLGQAAPDIGHFGTNTLVFEPVGNWSPDAAGKGLVEYDGGQEPKSRWRASFRFAGLDAFTDYTVAVRGRFGADDTPDADTFTELCSFTTDDQGSGTCFWYFRGLARLNVVQLRLWDADGKRVLQASRNGNFGSITTTPNRYSPGGELRSRQRAAASGS